MRQSFEPSPRIVTNRAFVAAKSICEKIQKAGFEAYFVGGSVRDMILDPTAQPHEFDIATSALPEDVTKIFPGSDFVGKAFGVSLVKQAHLGFEVTTFRKEGQYTDRRHPDSIEMGTLEEDSNRRDFTMNALYWDPVAQEIVDLHDGLEDISKRRLRCVGEPRARLHEDALRILRLFRFAANFGFGIEKQTLQAAIDTSDGLLMLSRERIIHEIEKVRVARFEPFAELVLKHVPLSCLDEAFHPITVISPQGNAFGEGTHHRLPLGTFAHEIFRRSEARTAAATILWRAFSCWPVASGDKEALKLLYLDLPALLKFFEGRDGALFDFLFLKTVRTQRYLTVSEVAAHLELIESDYSLVPPCKEIVGAFKNVDGSLTLSEFVARLKYPGTRLSSEQIAQRVDASGRPPQFVGLWNLWQETQAFRAALGILTEQDSDDSVLFKKLETLAALQAALKGK